MRLAERSISSHRVGLNPGIFSGRRGTVQLTLGSFLLLSCFLLMWLTACKSEAPAEAQPTRPPQEKVDCAHVMDWIRERPMSKQCSQDSDCSVQRDNCCDMTAVNRSYAMSCERTCRETCPQDSSVGQNLEHSAVCRSGTCEVASTATSAFPTPSAK